MSETELPAPRMAIGRREMLIGGAMLAASALALARMPEVQAMPVPKKRFENWVPTTIGPWRFAGESGLVLPPPDALSERLYDNLVARTYTAEGLDPVMLLVVYNNIQDGVLVVHRPEVCYPVGGYALTPTLPRDIVLPGLTLPANAFTATGADRTEQVLYWTRMGEDFPRSWAMQRLAVARANIAGRIPDGAMVRLSVIGDDPESAIVTMERFVQAFVASSPPPLRRLVVGATA